MECARKRFTEDAKRRSQGTGRSLVNRFVDSIQEPREEFAMEGVGETEKIALLAIFQAMLAFRPSERATTKEIIESEWMLKWALPVL